MSDKPLIQHALADSIASFMAAGPGMDSVKFALLVETAWVTLLREWPGIDRLRLDKFMTLVRKLVNRMFAYVSAHKWEPAIVRTLTDLFANYPLNLNDAG
jgi:ribosomal RNA-processing protein 1